MERLRLVLAVAIALGVMRLSCQPRISPDGEYYLKPRGDRPRPYAWRWVWPTQQLLHWEILSYGCLGLTAIALGWQWGIGIALLFLGLPLVRTCIILPVLTDAPALLCYVTSVVFNAPVLGAIGGTFNEKAPIFSAIALGSPWPLVGLVFPLLRHYQGVRPLAPTDPEWLRHPVRAALAIRGRWESPQALVLPWGMMLLGVGGMSIQHAALCVLAYAQLLVAQDGARLYLWAFPAFIPGLCAIVPPHLWALVVVVHWLSPWRRTL